MPELPEVETTVRGLRPFLDGARIRSVDLRRAGLRRDFPVDLVQRMTGATVTAVGRRAKYGIVSTDRDDHLIFHLGMSGRWRVNAGDPGTHDHLILITDRGDMLALNDPRRFGSVDLVAGDPETAFAPFAAMGPEPLSSAFDGASLKRALAGRKAPIKTLLLDQRLVAGLGNIYVCEALNLAKIDPRAAGGTLSAPRLRRLADAVKAVLEASIAAGGSSMRDFAGPEGRLGYFAKQWRVYGREGRPCPCTGGTVARIVQGGRSTFFCRHCQKR